MIQKLPLILFLACSISARGADFYGPRTFSQILDSSFSKSWTPNPISKIGNRSHILILDADTQQYCLSVTEGDMSGLQVVQTSSLTDSNATYGKVLRSMFQLLDLTVEIQSTSSLTGTFTIRPELKIYNALDTDGSSGIASSSGLQISPVKAVDLSVITNPGHLVFDFTGTPNSAKAQAASRYVFDSTTNSLVQDTSWSSSHWLKIGADGASLVTSEAEATTLTLVDALDLIDFSNNSGESFNPAGIDWQTNSFASWPVNPSTGLIDVDSLDESQLSEPDGLAYKDIDENYRAQFGNTTEATAVASAYLDQIKAALLNAGESLRYPKSFYLNVRENMLSHTFAAVDGVNSELGASTIPFVYFTNAQDDSGNYHPFMVIGAHNGTGGPNFLIDVARPPGDGISGEYSDQSVTRNAVLSSSLFRIPLKDYGLVASLTENDLSSYNSLAQDAGLTSTDYDVYNYASTSISGLAVDGVKIYPAMNNTLVFAPVNAEITSTGVHVGRGMGLHYHADGHAFNGNGINLYNLDDYEGHSHPPVIGFSLDGLALYGRYETSHSSMDGYSVALDEYGSHDHDDYGHHYHAFSAEVSNEWQGVTTTFTEHFLLAGAHRGLINDIPDFQNGGTSQLKDSELAKYVGMDGTYVTTSFEIESRTTHTITISSSTGGAVSGAGSYESGSSVSLGATPDSGYYFAGWSGDANGTTNPLSITIESDLTISPIFQLTSSWSNSSDLGDGWKNLDWFGTFFEGDSPWIYHTGMKWLYLEGDDMDSTWLHMEDRGWLFTTQSIFPFLYDASTEGWVYFLEQNGEAAFYEYQTSTWTALD
ncbi:MAG: hypothetical protein OSA95_05340 [Opitutales bacterium]|nr:hypothetical protein [Opitutales bacterium]